MTAETLQRTIKGCRKNSLRDQRELYQAFYRYGLSICQRYCESSESAREVLNDAFLKVFKHIDTFDDRYPFQSWFARVVTNTAINYYRQHVKDVRMLDLEYAEQEPFEADTLLNYSAEALLGFVQRLPPAYRLAYNLHAIEGYEHREIAEMLGISEGTSKSNLFKARLKLQKMLRESEDNLDRYASQRI
ncbi:MAG: RNA polymerase sigma factor [Sphingobacteriaceae bacterium]|nr:RNA polymerase sigma factor [Cytophagaceae bacterium]